MGTQQLPLCWNNHQTEILATFQRLLVEESFVDVTLACEGISLKAHKAILSACSPFFQDLFMENPCKHPIVIMKDIKYRDLKGIVDFMYHGGINVAPDQLSEFLKTAEALKVKGLSEHSSTTILDLNKQLRAQEKTPKKTTLFQQSLPSCLQSKDFAQIQSIRENNACCEQQSSTATDFVAGRDVCSVEERTKVFSVKSEPIEDACSEEILPEHTSDDSLLSVHYDGMFVPQMEITEGDQNLVLVPRCPQEIITSEALQQSSDASSHDTMLPLGHTTSAESLGVVISPDVTENSESVMQYMPFEHSNVAIHSSPNQDIKPVALTSYEESVVCPTSNQLHQRYNSADLRVKRTADSLEENSFISYEHEANQAEWIDISVEKAGMEQKPIDMFGHPSFSSEISMRTKQKISCNRNVASGPQTGSRSKNSMESGSSMSRGNYTVGNLRDAVNAVKHGMPLRQAQRLFKVPRTTIHTRIKGRVPVTLTRSGRCPLLGKAFEEELKQKLRAIDDDISKIPIGKCLDLVYNIAEKTGKSHLFPNGPASRRWLKGFMKRHNLT